MVLCFLRFRVFSSCVSVRPSGWGPLSWSSPPRQLCSASCQDSLWPPAATRPSAPATSASASSRWGLKSAPRSTSLMIVLIDAIDSWQLADPLCRLSCSQVSPTPALQLFGVNRCCWFSRLEPLTKKKDSSDLTVSCLWSFCQHNWELSRYLHWGMQINSSDKLESSRVEQRYLFELLFSLPLDALFVLFEGWKQSLKVLLETTNCSKVLSLTKALFLPGWPTAAAREDPCSCSLDWFPVQEFCWKQSCWVHLLQLCFHILGFAQKGRE